MLNRPYLSLGIVQERIVHDDEVAIRRPLKVELYHIGPQLGRFAKAGERVIGCVRPCTAMADAQDAVCGGVHLVCQPIEPAVDAARDPGPKRGPGDEHLP